MASIHAPRESRYIYDDYHAHAHAQPSERRHHRRHRSHREAYLDEDDYPHARRRHAEDARRTAEEEPEFDDLRARGESYYSRPAAESRHEAQRMAHDVGTVREAKPRGHRREVRRDGVVRKKRRDVVADDRSDDYVYGRPRSGGVIEEVTVRHSSARRRSDEGGSSRTLYSPPSGSRSVSLRAVEAPKLSRSKSAREPARPVYMATRPSTRRGSTQKLATPAAAPVTRTRAVSVREHPPRRSPGFLTTLFAPAPRPSTAVSHKEVPRVECLVCMRDERPIHKTALLGCGHRMCHTCLKRQFLLSVKDPQHMPPRCCTNEHIPLRYVERLFDDAFKRTWNRKYQEYTTANRIYCPQKNCGEWIKPTKTRIDFSYGRKYAKCGRCGTKVCMLCNGKYHTRRECPKDPETNRIVQMAKDKGWQRCYNCKAIVELKEGCNHMTCRCQAQFCMVCAAPWKTCNCPWFDYTFLDEEDRLNDMRVPDHNVIEVIEEPESTPPPIPPPVVRHTTTRIRHRTERDLDLGDESLAAHLQAQLRLDSNHTPSDMRPSDPGTKVYGLGNSGAHHMNESYTVRPLANPSARATVGTSHRMSAPLLSRGMSMREPPRVSARGSSIRHSSHTSVPSIPSIPSSTMAGLSRDGTKRGANRVGTWLNHVEVDPEAIHTAPRNVEVDDWKMEGSIVGIP